jgi:hypothetical protein
MTEEIWKDIPGYGGKYQASNLGNIKSVKRTIQGCNQFGNFEWLSVERLLKPGKHDKYGHLSVVLNNPRRTYLVHQLVMQAFVGKTPKEMEICHNNCDASDNRLCNLRFDTRTENMLDVYRNGRSWKSLTSNDVGAIRFGLFCGITCRELGAMYDVCHQTISKIKRGLTYTWLK